MHRFSLAIRSPANILSHSGPLVRHRVLLLTGGRPSSGYPSPDSPAGERPGTCPANRAGFQRSPSDEALTKPTEPRSQRSKQFQAGWSSASRPSMAEYAGEAARLARIWTRVGCELAAPAVLPAGCSPLTNAASMAGGAGATSPAKLQLLGRAPGRHLRSRVARGHEDNRTAGSGRGRRRVDAVWERVRIRYQRCRTLWGTLRWPSYSSPDLLGRRSAAGRLARSGWPMQAASRPGKIRARRSPGSLVSSARGPHGPVARYRGGRADAVVALAAPVRQGRAPHRHRRPRQAARLRVRVGSFRDRPAARPLPALAPGAQPGLQPARPTPTAR